MINNITKLKTKRYTKPDSLNHIKLAWLSCDTRLKESANEWPDDIMPTSTV